MSGDDVRLQKVLASAGVASRRKSEELIEAGRVKVNGRVVTELGTKVRPGRDRISVDGKPISAQTPVYVLLNKPDAVVCSAEGLADDRGRPTVLSLIRGISQRVYPVGRLDFHSRGLLLLTNDGDLAAALTHPRHQVPKTYHVKFQGRLDEDTLEALLEGVELEDGTVTGPASEVFVIKETTANTWVQMTISQGINRQIRRMGDALDHPVLKLIRVAIADLGTEGLDEGAFRHLRETEIEQLKALTMSNKPRKSRGRRRKGR